MTPPPPPTAGESILEAGEGWAGDIVDISGDCGGNPEPPLDPYSVANSTPNSGDGGKGVVFLWSLCTGNGIGRRKLSSCVYTIVLASLKQNKVRSIRSKRKGRKAVSSCRFGLSNRIV